MNFLWLAVFIAMLLYMAGIDALSEDEDAVAQAVEQAVVSQEFLVWSSVAGVLITVFVAYRSARRAGILHLRHGGWTAAAAGAVSMVFLLGTTGAEPVLPWWYTAFSVAALVPAGIAGGWLALKASRLNGRTHR